MGANRSFIAFGIVNVFFISKLKFEGAIRVEVGERGMELGFNAFRVTVVLYRRESLMKFGYGLV